MIDETMKKAIEVLAQEELQRANKVHAPRFNTEHEGYAVIKEEVEEAQTEMEFVKYSLESFWNRIKQNNTVWTLTRIEDLKISADNLAAEAIQVSAMCSKFIESFREKDV